MWTREEVKERGKEALKRNYWMTVGASIILGFCAGGSAGGSAGSSSNYTNGEQDMLSNIPPEVIITILCVACVAMIIGILVKIFLLNPLAVSCYKYFVENDAQPANLDVIPYAFKNNYKNIVTTMFLRDLYIALWSLLCVIPGIVKSYEYMMVPYLLADNSELTTEEAFAMSKEMMMGNKMDTFVLQLSFLGWIILSVLTCGILAVFYVGPYMECTIAALYNNLKEVFAPTDNYYDPAATSNEQAAF